VPDNLFVRFIKSRYLWQLKVCLKYRWVAVLVMGSMIVGTCFLIPHLGREFMPELEEGNLWIRGTLPLNVTLERQGEVLRQGRAPLGTHPGGGAVFAPPGRAHDGAHTARFYNHQDFSPPPPPHARTPPA